jgi:proteic killer suppression protein
MKVIILDISFTSSRMEKLFNSSENLIKAFGEPQATKIELRMEVLQVADNLGLVPHTVPERRHELVGKRKGQFAVNLKHPYRLVFEPDHDPIPLKDDGGIDLEQVTAVKILDVIDYH